ncbi:MAG: VWA domain-containing protein [Armatimonadota bacterium]|nr:MAG: VWA domain-containing protein [Armatimonadota bacterium]
MSSDMEITITPERAPVGAASGEDRQAHLLVQLRPTAAPTARVPVDACFVLDCSGTMRRFQLAADEIARWADIARGRGELQMVTADRREGAIFTGRTAQELQATATKPLVVAARAVKEVVGGLSESDSASLIAFADRASVVYDGASYFDKGQMFEVINELLTDSGAFQLGDGTMMAQAVELAGKQIAKAAQAGTVSRVIIITDGIVHDPGETLQRLDNLRAQGAGITTIGIGQDFDEEYLARVADRSGGQYYYAADPSELGRHLSQELSRLQATACQDARFGIKGERDTVVVDIHQVQPAIRGFEEIVTEEGWTKVKLGELPGGEVTSLLVELGLPDLPDGQQHVATIEAAWRSTGSTQLKTTQAEAIIPYQKSLTPAEPKPEIAGIIDRVAVYKAEREAQWAQQDGDVDRATRRLREATRLLKKIGDDKLAAEFERQAEDLEKGAPEDRSRTKRLKAATRRLGA